ncbi:MAG: hypothetical protein GY699_10785, partial [Desulfobacteraceae bacterium]|nr:hypothetical protein [Desulfobacteraceae bacterium]
IQAIAVLEAPNVKSSWTVNASTGINSGLQINADVLDSNTGKTPVANKTTKKASSDDSDDDSDNDSDD